MRTHAIPHHLLQDPKKYIQTILSVYKKYECIIRQQFKKEVGFKAALEKACAKFINKNAVTGKAKNSNFSAEFLAQYCHILLKKSNKCMDDTDVEAALDEIMIIFRFIEDKDVFEGFYKRRLAERLVRLSFFTHTHQMKCASAIGFSSMTAYLVLANRKPQSRL